MQRDAVVLSLRPCKISETSFTYLKAESYNRWVSLSRMHGLPQPTVLWMHGLLRLGKNTPREWWGMRRSRRLPASKDSSLLGYSFQKYLCLWPHKAFISTVLLYCHTLCPQNTCLVFVMSKLQIEATERGMRRQLIIIYCLVDLV